MLTPEQLKNFFARCYCITLPGRKDRRAAIEQNVLPQWPFAPLEYFSAIDGRICPPPPWWSGSAGSWGCRQSHSAIIEKCLQEKVASVLILEDDAVLCKDFAARCAEFLAAVPDDWEQIYLGGEHLALDTDVPKKINAFVSRPFNVNRTHAYALSNRGMAVMYHHIQGKRWVRRHHIDHHYGILHENRKIAVYSPAHLEWFVGQSGASSNIGRINFNTPFFNHGEPLKTKKMVMVVGPSRSGSSCLAGVLDALGVPMGNDKWKANIKNEKGYFEDRGLVKLCSEAYSEGCWKSKNDHEERVQSLKRWAWKRNAANGFVGGKFVTLCQMLPEMVEAWPQLAAIVPERPIEEIVASMEKGGWWPRFTHEQKVDGVRRLCAIRDRDIARLAVPALRLPFAETIAWPQETVAKIVAFLALSATPEQIQSAVEFIDPKLKHNNIESAA